MSCLVLYPARIAGIASRKARANFYESVRRPANIVPAEPFPFSIVPTSLAAPQHASVSTLAPSFWFFFSFFLLAFVAI